MEPLNISLPMSVEAQIPVLQLLVKVVDHLREDSAYEPDDRATGLASAEMLIKIIKTKTGNQSIVGRGTVGR